jgi:caffeoyl-CoA O-methyltransferase
MDLVSAEIERYCLERSRAEPQPLQALAEETRASMPGSGMLCGRVEGRLLKLLAQLVGARRVLEIGTYTGYSGLSLAEALPEDGRVITCELDPKHRDFAQRHLDASPHGRKVEIRLGPALATIATLEGPFDLVFIDADKENYPAYWTAVVPKVRSGGIIIVDNALWSGRVLAPSDTESRAIDRLNREIERDERVENVLLTVRDGVHLARKR